jgi:hypothetical protein
MKLQTTHYYQNQPIIEQTDISFSSFFDLNTEQILQQHLENQASTSLFFLEDYSEKKSGHYAFIVTRDASLVKKMHMIAPPLKKTQDLFAESSFVHLKISGLLNEMENNLAQFYMDFNGQQYSFRLAKGLKALNSQDKIQSWYEEQISSGNNKKIKP